MNTPTKRCSLCGEMKPATPEIFTTRKTSKDGLGSWCRICYREYINRRDHGDDYEQWLSDRQLLANMKAKGLKRCGRGDQCVAANGCWQPATNEYFARSKRQLDGFANQCKSCKAAYHVSRKEVANAKKRAGYDPVKNSIQCKNSYAKNADKRKAYVTEWRKQHPNKVREYDKAWQDKNPEKILEKARKWVLNNPEKATMKTQKRLARKRNLPDTMTANDWKYAIEHFNHCCAVCGKSFGDSECHADHWIPLNCADCPGTVPTNVIPLCGGKGGCNQKKSDKMPFDWLVQTYEETTAHEIHSRIQAYFNSLC